MGIEEARRFYAEEIRAVGNIRSQRVVEAFARVPRERFLGAGPWQVACPELGFMGGEKYRVTADDDPKHLYHNVAVAIDTARDLNNGQPSALGAWLDGLDLADGDRVFHLGCGVGYYTAVIAEVVGPAGSVLAAEVDADLAARAKDNLAAWPNVEVVAGDGAALDPGPCAAIMINAGVTHPRALWLDRLQPAGRLMVPITAAMPPSTLSKGGMLKVERQAAGFSARFVSFVMIYTATSLRDAGLNGRIGKALGAWTMQKVNRLRRDAHDEEAACWLHGADFCLSMGNIAPPASV